MFLRQIRIEIQPFFGMIGILAGLFLCAGPFSQASAAEAAFVGRLALAADDDVADQLELTPEIRERLAAIIADREDAALEVALRIKDLPPAEQQAALAPFVAESERQGFALFTPEQQAKLEQIRLRQIGMPSLREPELAAMLRLSDEQQQQIRSLLAERTTALTAGGADNRDRVAAEFERKLASVLTKPQRVAWEVQAGISPAESLAAVQAAEPAAAEPAAPPAVGENPAPEKQAAAPRGESRLQFNFRYAPWKDVLDWFAEQADLSLVLDAPPAGTFNYTDSREYTAAQAIDLLNSVLLTKGYTLVRRERMLMVINLEDGIPPALVERVAVEELDDRGKFELLSTLFQLDKMTPENAEIEIKKLIGPQGSIVVLPSAKQILVTETAGNLRTIRSVIEAVEKPSTPVDQKVHVFDLQNISADELLVVARQLLGLPEGLNAAPDGSIRIAVDPLGARLFVSGQAEVVARFEEILKLTDVAASVAQGGPLAVERPQLEVYAVANADPASVLQVMQTLLAGLPDVRLATDPKTGNLVALARPSEHRTIQATLEQMQRDQSQIEVMQLRRVDPQVAVLAINKLFGAVGEGGAVTGPRVEADPITRQLLIRGSQSQVSQIRTLLQKMGEDDSQVADADRGNVRIVPLSGKTAEMALQQMEAIWPTMRRNRIRVVTPSEAAPGLQERGIRRADEENDDPQTAPDLPDLREFKAYPPKPLKPAPGDEQTSTQRLSPRAARIVLAAFQAEPAPGEKKSAEAGAEIVVAPGPGRIVIASSDIEALNAFEDLLLSLGDQTGSAGQDFTVYYLKYAKADIAAALLQQIINGESAEGGDEGGGGGLMGDMASSMLGDMGGGLLGSLLGGDGGSITTSGAVSITPDKRLNALIVKANPTDLDLVDQLLRVIDQKTSPEDVETAGKPRLIPLFYTSATEVAAVVRQVYASRIDSGASTQQRQPSPEDFMRALRGGRRGGGDSKVEEQVKIGIGVDTRSNTIIVTAPDPLFGEVKALVDQLDAAGKSESETLRVVTLKKANPEIVQRALTSILGASVTTSTTSASTSSSGPNQTAKTDQPKPDEIQDQIRRRIEFFNSLRGGGGGGRGGFGGGRGPGGGGPGGGSRGGRGGR